MREHENKLKLLEASRKIVENSGSAKHEVRDIASEVRKFIDQFEARYLDASLEEKKALIKRCIRNIEIFPDEKVATVNVRCIPALPQIQSVIE